MFISHVSGHCYDANTGQPPRGLQFTLTTNNSDHVQDTIVMANLVGHMVLVWSHDTWSHCTWLGYMVLGL